MRIPIPKLKTDIVQNIVIAILAALLLLSNFPIVAQFLGKLNPLASYQRQIDELSQRVVLLEYDRVRIEDVSNLLLAIQDYNFDAVNAGSFPESLEQLKEKGYLGENRRLADPDTGHPYFYQKRQDDFVLCVWLSDMIKGVNTAACSQSPSEAVAVAEAPPQDDAATQTDSKRELEIIGTPFVNVRREPTAASEIVAKVVPGDVYEYTGVSGVWYYIVINDEKEGWVHGDYVRQGNSGSGTD